MTAPVFVVVLGWLTSVILFAGMIWALGGVLIAMAETVSWFRWSIAIHREQGTMREIKWHSLPFAFAGLWARFALSGHGDWRCDGGRWSGVGKWVVYPNCAGQVPAERKG